ncbi:MAG: hypothetical protein RLZZ20_1302 [Pseudomonadota bacterium]
MDIPSINIEVRESIVDGVLSNNEIIVVRCSISEPTSDLDLSDFVIPEGCSIRNSSYLFGTWSDGSRYLQGIIFNLNVSADIASTDNVIALKGNSYIFKSGSPGFDVSSTTFDIDTIYPTCEITLEADTSKPLISTDGVKLTFLFSEPVAGFTQSDILLSPDAGTISAFQKVSDTQYTAIFTPKDNTQLSSCIIEIASNSYFDLFVNEGRSAESVSFSIDTPDTTPPVPTLVLSSAISLADGIDITISFNEDVTGFDKNDIQLPPSDGSLIQISPAGNGKIFTFHYSPGANWLDSGGSTQIGVIAGGYADLAGNAGLASDIKPLVVDIKPPLLDISLSDQDLISNETCRIDFTFNESVKFFTINNLSVDPLLGTLDQFQPGDSAGRIYSVIFTPRSGVEQSAVKILVDGGYTDIAGNSGIHTESPLFSIDTLAPVASIALADGADAQLISGESLKLLITFTEVIKHFDLGDLSLNQAAGVLDNFQQEDTEGKVYSVVFTPQSGIENSGVTMLLSDEYTDMAGNPGLGAVSSALSIDTLAPGASITVGDTHLTRGESTLLTFTFTETVSNFSVNDVLLEGAIAGLTQFTEVEAGKKFTALYTPPSETIDTNNIFSIAAGSYTDLAGNSGQAAQSENVSIDTVGKILFGTTSSDAIVGTAGADRISGLPQSGSGAGKDSSDLLMGLGGADVFVLGNQNTYFYNDGNNSTAGTKDFAAIGDFSVAAGDKIEVKAGTYFFSALTVGKLSGTGLYLDTNNSGAWDAKDELIGFLVGVNPGSVSAAHDLMLV